MIMLFRAYCNKLSQITNRGLIRCKQIACCRRGVQYQYYNTHKCEKKGDNAIPGLL